MTVRSLAAAGALLTFAGIVILNLAALGAGWPRILVTFAAVFGIALLAAALARWPSA